MKNGEQVTFGGGGLIRDAHLRKAGGTPLLGAGRARIIPFWRGKPMMGFDDAAPATFQPDHEVFAGASEAPLFLGRTDDTDWFAQDISDWVPGEMPETLGAFFDPSQQTHPATAAHQRFAELRGVMTMLGPVEAEIVATARSLLEWHRLHKFCANCGAPSVVAQAGWQRDCPTCGRHHFPRTDPVVIMLVTHENSVLVGRSPGWPEGMYSLLAGFVEPGETIEAAVRRETLEESGVKVGAVEYLSCQPWPFPSSLMFGCRGHALNTDVNIDPEEIEDAQWVSREEMMATFIGETPERKPAREGAIAHFLLKAWLADRLD